MISCITGNLIVKLLAYRFYFILFGSLYRVPLANGGSLIIEQTEALVSIDVNGGHAVLVHETSQQKAVIDVNLAAARQVS